MMIGLVLLGLHLLGSGKWRWIEVIVFSALLLSVGYQAWRIFPYTPLCRVQVESSAAGDRDIVVRVVTANVQRISGLIGPRIGRGMFNSYHADYFFLRFPLDHVFHSGHFKLIDLRRLAHIGSDHFPFYAALSFHPENKDAAGKLPAPEPEEKKEAAQTVEEAKEK